MTTDQEPSGVRQVSAPRPDILSIMEASLEAAPEIRTWINEAQFGFRYVSPFAEELSADAAVLEIGCGVGILLTLLKERFPHLTVDGLEPFGRGFQSLRDLQAHVRAYGTHIHEIGYEDYKTDKRYDLIYLVNVFEHLPDWRHFLQFVKAHLAPGGRCVILCPNYSFPYESHFKLPIVFNKSVTGHLFRRQIESFEAKHNLTGLWQSLNFVTMAQVIRAVGPIGLEMKIHDRVLTDMVARLATDPDFADRHRVLGGIARFLDRVGALKLFSWPIMSKLRPYMLLEIIAAYD